MSPALIISPVEKLTAQHRVDKFKCGKNPLDLFIRKYALQNQMVDSSQTFVVHRDYVVIGYYSLVYSEISLDGCPPRIREGMPGDFTVGVMRFARFAVLKSEQGKGIGKILLKDAFIRTVAAADIGGLKAIIVDAMDKEIMPFYKNLGFTECPIGERMLMISIQDVRASLV